LRFERDALGSVLRGERLQGCTNVRDCTIHGARCGLSAAVGGDEAVDVGGWFGGEDEDPEDVNDAGDEPSGSECFLGWCVAEDVEMNALSTVGGG
jgi:hypothetical protein